MCLAEHDLLYGGEGRPTLTVSAYQRLTTYLDAREHERATLPGGGAGAYRSWLPPNAAQIETKAKTRLFAEEPMAKYMLEQEQGA